MKKIVLFILMMLPVAAFGQDSYSPDYGITVERKMDILKIEEDINYIVILRLESAKRYKSGVKVTVYKQNGKKRKKIYKKYFPNSYLYLTHDDSNSIALAQGKSITQGYFWKEDYGNEKFSQGWIKEFGFE